MEKVRLKEKGIIELPKNMQEKFGLEKDTEFDVFFDGETIYLKRVHKSLKDVPFGEVAKPFREMSKKQEMKPATVSEEIREYRKKG
jgi:bifunctional DNA-binding transcriptional regulator/antitoxin component of YhaV-PrlF toxin-antitoxin module